jgi:hypothetical protein
MTFKLLSTANPKIQKGTKLGYLSFILHLAPADLSGHNTCPKATAGCKSACLNTAGRGGMFKRGENTNMIQKARIRKTKYFYEDRAGFMLDLAYDIQKGIKLAEKLGLKPVFRLNGTSDLSWEKYEVPVFCTKNIFELYPNVQFYDYTKVLGRKADYDNYFLIFSQADGNEADVNKAIAQGMNVATVFDEVPAEYKGRPVINADETDLRFLDPKGVIAGLKAKGKAKKDYSGFVIRLKEAA